MSCVIRIFPHCRRNISIFLSFVCVCGEAFGVSRVLDKKSWIVDDEGVCWPRAVLVELGGLVCW